LIIVSSLQNNVLKVYTPIQKLNNVFVQCIKLFKIRIKEIYSSLKKTKLDEYCRRKCTKVKAKARLEPREYGRVITNFAVGLLQNRKRKAKDAGGALIKTFGDFRPATENLFRG
jgi:hypothetical protein